jgi:hypothetical protein
MASLNRMDPSFGTSFFKVSRLRTRGRSIKYSPFEVEQIEDQIHKRTAAVSLKPLEKSESRDSVRIERYDFSIKNGVLQFQVFKLLDDERIFRIEPKAIP